MTENNNRAVITGLGMICAIGNSVDEAWNNAINSVSGIHKTTTLRSEERRVGKECRSRWSPYH